MAVDLDRIRETRLDINGRELGTFSGHVTQLLVYDIPAMVDEIESLRSEVSRLTSSRDLNSSMAEWAIAITESTQQKLKNALEEVSRLTKELAEHRAIVKHKQDFIMGEPRGVHKP